MKVFNNSSLFKVDYVLRPQKFQQFAGYLVANSSSSVMKNCCKISFEILDLFVHLDPKVTSARETESVRCKQNSSLADVN